ncbi:MAG: GDP-mannose 4,6-dehydratase [Gemmatimonadaceae bacterium]
MKTALITGVSGQDGSYLAELLIDKGYRVVGTTPDLAAAPSYFAPIRPRIEVATLDVRDRSALESLLAAVRPDEVYHLAAQSRVGASWEDPVGTADVSGSGALYMLEAVRQQVPNARVLVAGSCEVYGHAAVVPQDESTPHQPTSPYGIAKAFAQSMTAMYRSTYGLSASTAILFNHESPRRGPHFVSRKIAKGAVAIATGHAGSYGWEALGSSRLGIRRRRRGGHVAAHAAGRARRLGDRDWRRSLGLGSL